MKVRCKDESTKADEPFLQRPKSVRCRRFLRCAEQCQVFFVCSDFRDEADFGGYLRFLWKDAVVLSEQQDLSGRSMRIVLLGNDVCHVNTVLPRVPVWAPTRLTEQRTTLKLDSSE